MDVGNAYLSGTSDYFKVYNQRLAARDVDGIVYWYSPVKISQDIKMYHYRLTYMSRELCMQMTT